jgi:hypothetical protein
VTLDRRDRWRDPDPYRDAGGGHAPPAVSPGKRALTDRLVSPRRGAAAAPAVSDEVAVDVRDRAGAAGLLWPWERRRNGGAVEADDHDAIDPGGEPVNADAGGELADPEQEPGEPLPDGLRGDLETASGASLDDVRLHRGPDATALAAAHDARAVTVGRDIHAAAGEMDLGTRGGLHLIAHEVAHVAQQGAGGDAIAAKPTGTTAPDEPAEVEADRFADDFVAGRAPAPLVESIGGRVAAQRREEPSAEPSARDLLRELSDLVETMGTLLASLRSPADPASSARVVSLMTLFPAAEGLIRRIEEMPSTNFEAIRLRALKRLVEERHQEAVPLAIQHGLRPSDPELSARGARIGASVGVVAAMSGLAGAAVAGTAAVTADASSERERSPRVAKNALIGVHLYLRAKDALPRYATIGTGREVRQMGPGEAGPYRLNPAFNEDQEQLFFLAFHRERKQNEWVIGPATVADFADAVDIYVGAARNLLPGSRHVDDSQGDGAAKAPHMPSVLEQAGSLLETARSPWDDTYGGAALVGARNSHLRISFYKVEARKLAEELAAQVKGGADHMAARRAAVGGRNLVMHKTRAAMSPAGRYASTRVKSDLAIDVPGMTEKKVKDILDASIDSPTRDAPKTGNGLAVVGDGERGTTKRLRKVLEADSEGWARYRKAIEAGQDAKQIYKAALQELGEQPAVSRAIISSAGKVNKGTTILAHFGRTAGAAGGVVGGYEMIKTIVNADEGERWHVAAGALAGFTGGILGAELGSALFVGSLVRAHPLGASVILVVSLAGGLTGSAVGAQVGQAAMGTFSDVMATGMTGYFGPGSAQTGGYPGLHERGQRLSIRDRSGIAAKLEDVLWGMDQSLEELERKIGDAPDRRRLEALQRARLDLLDNRDQIGTLLLALASGEVSEVDVLAEMSGERS